VVGISLHIPAASATGTFVKHSAGSGDPAYKLETTASSPVGRMPSRGIGGKFWLDRTPRHRVTRCRVARFELTAEAARPMSGA